VNRWGGCLHEKVEGGSVMAAMKKFGRKNKKERPSTSSSATGNRGSDGVAALTEKMGKKVRVRLLYTEETGGGAQGHLHERCACSAQQSLPVDAL
jgi:hypothetical protein